MNSKRPRFAFETSLATTSLLGALVPFSLMTLLLLTSDISIYLALIILIFSSCIMAGITYFVWIKIRNQLRTTTNLVEALVAGDTTLRPNSEVKSGALAELYQLINNAALDIADQRQLSKEHHLAMSMVLEHMDIAVISLDENYKITLLNPKAKQLFALHQELIGLPIKHLGIDKATLLTPIHNMVTLKTEHVQQRVYLQSESYQLRDKTHTLLFFSDVQQLLQKEERTAWQRLLRVLSHEINNSLAPIASIGESLSHLVRKSDTHQELKTDLTDGLNIITQRAMTLNGFIREYQSLSRLPQPTKSLFSLKTLLKEQLELFPELNSELPDMEDVNVFADRTQISQVLVNLFKNAMQAVPNARPVRVELNWRMASRFTQLTIADNGTGISNPDNLFVPFYTTKPQGSGIGLVLSRQILFNHGGDLTLSNRADGEGACATISIPCVG